MLQFSIRALLFLTLYCAVGFAVSLDFGFEYFLAPQLLLLHFAVLCVLIIASIEYHGHRKRFSIAALFVQCVFVIGIFWEVHDIAMFDLFSIMGFVTSWTVGLLCAASYRAIVNPREPRGSSHPLDMATRILAKILPPADVCDQAGEQPNEDTSLSEE